MRGDGTILGGEIMIEFTLGFISAIAFIGLGYFLHYLIHGVKND